MHDIYHIGCKEKTKIEATIVIIVSADQELFFHLVIDIRTIISRECDKQNSENIEPVTIVSADR